MVYLPEIMYLPVCKKPGSEYPEVLICGGTAGTTYRLADFGILQNTIA
jgi:hypothetical protein